ncbi:MAG: translation initiation factor [Patescibacteria group bacterium]|nr:translation initiation factor [Patescibacteria group bacterium]
MNNKRNSRIIKKNRRDFRNDSKDNKKEDEYAEKILGQVIDALPNTHFRVKTEKGDMIAYLGGKMRVHKIRILVGDRVELLLDEYGGKARVTRRF